jgi:ketol-acid reductoisomerase
MKIYTEEDLEKNLLKKSTVAILGFGNQGHAHALNLRDSGISTVVGTRRGGTGWEQAAKAGFDSVGIAAAAAQADVVVVLLPDEVQGQVFREEIAPALRPGAAIVFPHGFTVAFDIVKIPKGHDVLLVAPKSQGHFLRKMFMASQGVPCLLGVAQDASGSAMQKALSYASLIGCLSAGALETTFREEAVTDLFGEQVVLCGGVPELIKAAFDALVGRGHNPEVAYLECMHELKIIVDLLYAGGVRYMRERISKTAAWGSYEAGERLVTAEVREAIERTLDRVESGEFARDWIEEAARGQRRLKQLIRDEAGHPIEAAGRRVRSLMPYLPEDDA